MTANTTEFLRDLEAYARQNTRGFSEIVNNKSLQLSYESLAQTQKADKPGIQALPKEDWWPKYVAKRLKSGMTLSRRTKGKTVKTTIQGRFTKQQATQASRAIIAGRSRAIAFHKAGWIPAIKRLHFAAKGYDLIRKSTGGARTYGVPKGSAIPARVGANPFAEIRNSAEGITKPKGVAALQSALRIVAADMRLYIARKIAQKAKRAFLTNNP